MIQNHEVKALSLLGLVVGCYYRVCPRVVIGHVWRRVTSLSGEQRRFQQRNVQTLSGKGLFRHTSERENVLARTLVTAPPAFLFPWWASVRPSHTALPPPCVAPLHILWLKHLDLLC